MSPVAVAAPASFASTLLVLLILAMIELALAGEPRPGRAVIHVPIQHATWVAHRI